MRAVIAHDGEQEGVGEAKREGEEHLLAQAVKEMERLGGQQVGQHAG